jgi:hypothetical protein
VYIDAQHLFYLSVTFCSTSYNTVFGPTFSVTAVILHFRHEKNLLPMETVLEKPSDLARAYLA